MKKLRSKLIIIPVWIFLNLFSTSTKSQENHENDSGETSDSITTSAGLGGVPQELDSTPSVEQEAQKIQAASLLIWTTVRGEWSPGLRDLPPNEVAEKAGISPRKFATFLRNIKKSSRLTRDEISAMQKDYKPELLALRLSARDKVINLVEKFQKTFGEFQSEAPEILTIFGESRNITGFTPEDDRLLQAKMATILHVLRNRTLYQSQGTKSKTPLNIKKWQVATQRFQFSCFEPYDVNLAMTLGPNRTKVGAKISNQKFEDVIKTIPKADLRALKNLSVVIASLKTNKIVIPKPLGDNDVRHYLTPVLLPFSRKSEKDTRKTLSGKMAILRLPNSSSPETFAVVPNWAQQKNLISKPPVDVLDPLEEKYHRITIPASDFVYFKGVL